MPSSNPLTLTPPLVFSLVFRMKSVNKAIAAKRHKLHHLVCYVSAILAWTIAFSASKHSNPFRQTKAISKKMTEDASNSSATSRLAKAMAGEGLRRLLLEQFRIGGVYGMDANDSSANPGLDGELFCINSFINEKETSVRARKRLWSFSIF